MYKRIFDVLGAIFLIVFLSPFLLLLSASVWLAMGLPVFFRQKRIGFNEVEFEILKFRTMRPPRGDESLLFSDELRVTKLGNFLRRTSLDELPEIWNILKGDMSFVGPRPLLDLHLRVFTLEQRRRHLVRPGLTGLAQISGRQTLTFRQRSALDVYYVENQGFWRDLMILFKTVGVVFGGEGVKTGQLFSEVDDVGLKKIIDDLADVRGKNDK